MSQYNADEAFRNSPSAVTDSLRVVMAIVGIVLMGVSLFYVVKALNVISRVLADPLPLAETLTKWSDTLGFAEGGMVEVDHQPMPVGRVVSALMLGVGTMIFAQIALSFLATGAKMLMQAAQRPR